MKPEKHVERYKTIRKTLNELLLKPIQERDIASISTLAHWASYHLISIIINQASIPENQQHKNHRGIKNVLRSSTELRKIIGDQNSNLLLELYNQIETQYLVKFQYGWTDLNPDYGELIKLLDQIVSLCKGLTKKTQKP